MASEVSNLHDNYKYIFEPLNLIVIFLNYSCSAIVSLSSFFCAVYWKDVLSVSIFVFALVAAFIGKILKNILAHKRPLVKENNVRTSYGMPSSHANSLFFSYHILLHITFNNKIIINLLYEYVFLLRFIQ